MATELVWRCTRSEADPELASDFEGLVANLGWDDYISVEARYAYRDYILQQQFLNEFLEGKRDGPVSPPGTSAHNYMLAVLGDGGIPCAQAIDFAIVVHGQDTWNYSNDLWQQMHSAILHHPRLHSGMDFPPGKQDPDHVQTVKWATTIKPQLIASGQWGKPWPWEKAA